MSNFNRNVYGGFGRGANIFDDEPDIEGYSKEEVKKLVEGWRQRADMFQIHKLAFERASKELAQQGKIDYDEFLSLARKHGRQIAAKENFDLDAAQNRFLNKKK